MQIPESPQQNPGIWNLHSDAQERKKPRNLEFAFCFSARFRRIIPGSEMSRDQTLSFTAVEVSRILLGLGGEFCSRAEFCSGLRRIRVGGAECKFQIPWLFSLLGNVVLSRMQIPNSRDCARRECRAESRDFDKHELTVKIPQKILLSRGEYRIMTDQNHKRNLSPKGLCLAVENAKSSPIRITKVI